MVITINSPFIPLLFKQKMLEENKQVGFLAATKLVRYLIARHCYKVNYKNHMVKLIENKKTNKQRNWDLFEFKNGKDKRIGKLIMIGGTAKDIATKGYTEYRFEFKNDIFTIKKPFMKRNYCELENDNGDVVATHKKGELLKWRRDIEVKKSYSDLEVGVFVLTLSLLAFVS